MTGCCGIYSCVVLDSRVSGHSVDIIESLEGTQSQDKENHLKTAKGCVMQ